MNATRFAIVLILLLAGAAQSRDTSESHRVPTLFQPGSGVYQSLPSGDRDFLWSDPPNLAGSLGSSERIPEFGLESEIANDFILSDSVLVSVTFWGGYWNGPTGCDPGIPNPGFIFKFFTDAGCRPGDLIASFEVTEYDETLICPDGSSPIYEWSVPVGLTFTPGIRYWFCVQFRDHPFPPQAGRLEALQVQDCESMFRSVFFGYPNWTPAGEWWPWEASQEFSSFETNAGGACCLEEGLCRIVSHADCARLGGAWQGVDIECDATTCLEAACCSRDGDCTMTTSAECRTRGVWQGRGTDCLSATCAPRAPGSVVAWGGSGWGHRVPDPNIGFRALDSGGAHCLAVRRDGTVVAWGDNGHGQCNVPQGLYEPIDIAAGGDHSLAIRSDSSIVGWGYNYNHQCDPPAPNTGFIAIDAGSNHSIGLKSSGRVLAWGNNVFHQCEVPDSIADIVAIAAGSSHNLALSRDGSIVAWGWNGGGACEVPAPNSGFVAIAAGGAHSLGLKTNGSIVAWGYNSHGQCDVPEPNEGYVAIACGAAHSLGLRADGTIEAWGSNERGECNIPAPNRGFAAIAAGFDGGSYAVSMDVSIAPPQLPERGLPEPTGEALAGMFGADSSLAPVSASPNPSSGPARLVYEASGDAEPVVMEIHDAAGRSVRRLTLGPQSRGRHFVDWDGCDGNGRPLPAGVFLVRVLSGGTERTGRLVILGR